MILIELNREIGQKRLAVACIEAPVYQLILSGTVTFTQFNTIDMRTIERSFGESTGTRKRDLRFLPEAAPVALFLIVIFSIEAVDLVMCEYTGSPRAVIGK